MYTVSQKPPTILFVYNSAKYWQALKKIHLWIQLEICNRHTLKYVANRLIPYKT